MGWKGKGHTPSVVGVRVDCLNGTAMVIGKKDLHGVLLLETSLKHLIGSCTIFVQEESLLQTIGKRMGFMADCAPKCEYLN